MLARLPLVLAGLLSLPDALEAQPRKQENVTGNYEVKFEAVANNCQQTGYNLDRGTINVSHAHPKIVLSIPSVPVMTGRMGRDGKFTVRADRGGTAIQGVQAALQSAGRVDGEIIQFVLIMEHWQGKRPLCTQSWNASGVRADKLK